MFDAIARVLAFFYSLPVVGGSFGLAIIMLTAAVMILLMPLTLRATRSTIKMQEVQPKLKELQKKHKDDKQALNTELMALYSANGINPVGGCLPMVAQLPVFLVLFNVLRGLSRRVSEAPFYAISEQARSQLGGASVAGETFDPRYLSKDSEMYLALSERTEMAFGPFDLAAEARDVIQNDIIAGIPYVFLILFVVGTSFYQQRQVSSRRTGNVGMNPQQEMILKVLPLASGVWSFLFPAGLVLYWATSNVFRIGQQSYITRAFYGSKAQEAADALSAGKTADDTDAFGSLNDDSSDEEDEEEDGENDRASSKSGSKKSTADKKKKPSSRDSSKPRSAATNGKVDSTNGESSENNSGSKADRAEAWEKRRRERARSKAGSERNDTSSRVTPKGTKPGGSKKKRKR